MWLNRQIKTPIARNERQRGMNAFKATATNIGRFGLVSWSLSLLPPS